jgi:hypothetical protein
MRPSSAVLTDTSVRLWDLSFPTDQPLLARTRAAYVHLDNLIAYSKRDRDAKVDAYLACFRPDETVLLFFLGGDLVNAAVLAPIGRFPIAISEAMAHLRAEPERAEIAFHTASAEQLAAMYATCSQKPLDLKLDASSTKTIFDSVMAKKWTGLLELIAHGGVNYVMVKDGRFQSGKFCDQDKKEDAKAFLARMFAARPGEARSRVAVKAFTGLAELPQQAAPALVRLFRQFVWDLVESAGKEIPDAPKRAERIRQKLTLTHEALKSVGGARGAAFADPIVEPTAFAEGVATWTKDFLVELEVVHPTIAPRLLKDATREQRFQFAALGFFERLPWRIEW